jgi:hypothetical protein
MTTSGLKEAPATKALNNHLLQQRKITLAGE